MSDGIILLNNAPMNIRKTSQGLLKYFLLPCLLYLVGWCVLTWPLATRFTTDFFCDSQDGMTFAWIFWWFEHAIVHLRQWPLWTDLLHHPYGITLLAHHPMPVNSLPGVLLLQFMPLNQVYNFFVVLAFVLSGWSAFLLCRRVSGNSLASLFGGWLFTFSAFHFAHARGHLNLVTMQWMPLFLLAWLSLLERPALWKALASAVALLLVLASDTYYFLYSVMAGSIMAVWVLGRERRWQLFFHPPFRAPLLLFVVLMLATAGWYVGAVLRQSRLDPYVPAHVAREQSLDLLAPFVHSAQWKFGELTRPVWSRYVAQPAESSVHLGLSVIVLLGLGLWWRKRPQSPPLGVWYVTGLFFFIMALGPRLQVAGRILDGLPLPYALAERLFPPLKMAGTPVRMMAMVYLASAVIAAAVLTRLMQMSFHGKIAACALAGLMILEQWPVAQESTRPTVPSYMQHLISLPGNEPVLDLGASVEMTIAHSEKVPPSLHKQSLFYQTQHQRPMAFGFVARVPQSVYEQDLALLKTILEGDYSSIHRRNGFRYLAIPAQMRTLVPAPQTRPLAEDESGVLYDLRMGE